MCQAPGQGLETRNSPSLKFDPRLWRLRTGDFEYGVLCGVVWCGVVWCGVVWCGVVWCGVVWCGVVCRRRCYQMAKAWMSTHGYR